MAPPRGYLQVNGVTPDTRESCVFIVAQKKVDDLQRSGPSSKFHDMVLLPETLLAPCAIFKGLKREGLTDPYCYSKSPSRRLKDSRIELPSPPGFVFTVAVNKDHRGFVILDWEMRRVDPSNGGHPLNWQTDFGEKLWPNP